MEVLELIEETLCATSQVKEEGWLPQHVLIRHAETQQLHACIPLYLKGHSYGEYVFDNSWAVLASRVGQRYYVSSLMPPLESGTA